MTINEAGGELYSWFSKNDCYVPDEDFNKLILLSNEPERDKAALLCALENFEEISLIKKKNEDSKDYWVLNKKFTSLEQNVSISPKIALFIYNHVKTYSETAGLLEDYECDPLNISEKDIAVLLDMIKILSDK